MVAANAGSVITKDNLMAILTQLSTIPEYANASATLLLDQLEQSLPNQLPMYAELAYNQIPASFREQFVSVLRSRLDDVEKESKRKRIEKVISKLR